MKPIKPLIIISFLSDLVKEDDVKEHWISINTGLPVPRVKVLVAYKNGVTIAELDGYVKSPKVIQRYWRGVDGPKHVLRSVTHWMPLPEPPEV